MNNERFWPLVGLMIMAPFIVADRMDSGIWFLFLILMGLGPWAYAGQDRRGM